MDIRYTVDPFQRSVSNIATLIQRFDARLANLPFLVFDFRTLWHLTLSASVPESQKLKMDQLTSLSSNLLVTIPILEL